MSMRKRSRLSKHRQELAAEYMYLAKMLARYFVQTRPKWQRAVLIPDLEGEGMLALAKAARTYDKSKLPYPKAYFARAILNAMYKWIKRTTKRPGEYEVSMRVAESLVPIMESPDFLELAIQDLGEDDQAIARDRFQEGQTLRAISATHSLSLRTASVRSRALARTLAEVLDIRLQPHAKAEGHPSPDSISREALCDPRGKTEGRFQRGSSHPPSWR